MSRVNRFTGIPALPQGGGFTDYQNVLIGSVKENVELLTGLRGEADEASKAVTQGQVTTNQMAEQRMRQVSAKGVGFTISGSKVAGLDDYGKLLVDVQTLASDLAETRATLNFLIGQLKG
tara:strand:- start:1778 stop:2137 length:360 start_codon:yes stop_codon:yes gene_type:complete